MKRATITLTREQEAAATAEQMSALRCALIDAALDETCIDRQYDEDFAADTITFTLEGPNAIVEPIIRAAMSIAMGTR